MGKVPLTYVKDHPLCTCCFIMFFNIGQMTD